VIQEIEESLQFLEKLGIDAKDSQAVDDLRLINESDYWARCFADWH
jgi:hypothetical protein